MQAHADPALEKGIAANAPAPNRATTYTCAACGARVHMIGVSVRRDCEHVTSGILASIKATVYGESKVK